MFRSHVLICGGTGCTSNHSADLITEFERQIKNAHLENDVQIVKTGCFGLCAVGPICIVYPEGAFYSEVKVDDVKEIVEEHLAKGRLVERLLYKDHKTAETVKSLHDSNFMKMQTRVALRNCGVINPENIDEYIGTDGYQALIKALTEMKPQDVIDVIKASGLRGRGGGGFPTGLNGNSRKTNPATINSYAATPTKAIPARSWTDRFSKATPTPCLKQWQSQDMQSADIRAIFTFVRNTPSPFNV